MRISSWAQNFENVVSEECGNCWAVFIYALEDLDKDLECLYRRTALLRVVRDHCGQVFEAEAVLLLLHRPALGTVLPPLGLY